MSKSERRVLAVFRQFLMSPGQMLCFNGPQLKSYSSALRSLTEKGMLVKEKFKGGYALTQDGFAQMKDCKQVDAAVS